MGLPGGQCRAGFGEGGTLSGGRRGRFRRIPRNRKIQPSCNGDSQHENKTTPIPPAVPRRHGRARRRLRLVRRNARQSERRRRGGAIPHCEGIRRRRRNAEGPRQGRGIPPEGGRRRGNEGQTGPVPALARNQERRSDRRNRPGLSRRRRRRHLLMGHGHGPARPRARVRPSARRRGTVRRLQGILENGRFDRDRPVRRAAAERRLRSRLRGHK